MSILTEPFYGFYINRLLKHDTPKLFTKLYELDWYQSLHQQWFDDLQCQSGQQLLELGCGPGLFSLSVAKRNIDITAVDRSDKMIKVAQANAQRCEESKANITFVEGDAKALKFENEQFDCVIGASLLNVVKPPEEVLSEMMRVLKVGGKLSFLVPNKTMNMENVVKYIAKNDLRGFSAKVLKAWGTKPPRFERERVMELLEPCQLKDVVIDERFDGMVYTVSGVKVGG
ncbi:MAG: class I SAM-dependent methyltransferase [Algicola sp.]|nr:class I SAM-dependent methyltransferase [Algicola sp.]